MPWYDAVSDAERLPGPTDYLFDWVKWLGREEQGTFSAAFAAARKDGTAEDLTRLMVAWHNRAMQRQAQRRRLEREDEGPA